jgi:glucose/arabinose dehydrogenase
MSERSRRSDMRVRKSVKSRKEPPLVERRALPTRERLRRAGADFERGDTGQITMRDSPLERAFARNALTPEQYSAGQKYRHHWYHDGLADRLESIDLNRVFAIDLGAYSGMAKTESQLFHCKDTGRPRKPPARSDRTCWNGRCAAKLRSSKSARHWAGTVGRKPMRLLSNA